MDWAETPRETANKKRREKRQANDRKMFLHRTGWVYSDKRALEHAIPDPDNERIVRGGPAPKPSAEFMKYTESCDVADARAIMEYGQEFIEKCDLWDPKTTAISDYNRAYIEHDDTIQ